MQRFDEDASTAEVSGNVDIFPGDRVSHEAFGEGLVEEVRGEVATVRFAGMKRKTILLSYLKRQEPSIPARAVNARTLFDAYVMVDWSASNEANPGRDSIWYCLLEPVAGRLLVMNPKTRDSAVEEITAHLTELVSRERRVLVGFDFPYGFPAGTGKRLGFTEGEAWRTLWDEIALLVEDDPANRNNRFEVAAELNGALTTGPAPFWGCPPQKVGPFLSRTKPRPWPKEIPEFRLCDRQIPGTKSPWQLLGSGSVGSQALVGIPRLARLRDDPLLGPVSRVWPFETDLEGKDISSATGPVVLHAEIYPSLVPPSPFEGIKDAAQVRALAEHFTELDDQGNLSTLFDLSSLPTEERETVVKEEGWILGVRPKPGPAL